MIRMFRPLTFFMVVNFLALQPEPMLAEKTRTTIRTAPAPPSKENACRRAVQGFYDWYLPRLMREVRVTARQQALWNRPEWFSAALRRGLAEDLKAAAKHPDEIVGLDFEPIVNSQDPAARYVARKVTRGGRGYRVEVHAVVEGKASPHPDVIPEVVLQKGRWTFVNFHYPSEDGKEPGTDLLKLLRELREDRQKRSR